MYQITYLKDDKKDLIRSVRKFDWRRNLPGGWLTYGPPRKVTGYGDGSLYADDGTKYGPTWGYTAWSASVPFSNSTAVTKTKAIPKDFLCTGIHKKIRKALKQFGAKVDDSTGTGLWCNYYDRRSDLISSHTDDENYYERNFKDEPLFVSLTLYEDEDEGLENLARFQIKLEDGWRTIKLPHLSLFVMSGAIEHRVLRNLDSQKFRKRYNITFRTPIKREEDIIKNFRFFSNFNRYYRPTYMLCVPPNVFSKEIPKEGVKIRYDREDNKGYYRKQVFSIIKDNSNFYKVIREHSKFGQIFLMLNRDINRADILDQLKAKYNFTSKPPNTTTTQALYVLYKNEN